MWPRKPEMPQPLRDWQQGATEDRGWGMGRSLLEEALGLRAGWQGGGRPRRGCGAGWARAVVSQPGSSRTCPPNSGGPSFHKSAESFLLSHPSFQTCFLLGLQTYSHSSHLLPLSLTSECLLWLHGLLPALSCGRRWILRKKKQKQKRSFLQAGLDSPGQDCLLSTLSKRNWRNLGLGRQILSSNNFPSKPQMHFVSI